MQGSKGKKLSRKEFAAFKVWVTESCMCGLQAKINSYCFLTSIFAFILLVILQNPWNCNWSQFVDTSCRSLQNPQQSPCRISQLSKTRGVKLITHRGLGLAKSICAPNLEATGSNAKFCEFFWLEVLKLLCLQDRATIYESRCLRRVRLNMICNAAKK